ncbi:Rho-binding antiterminator [Pseudoalteromonas sp. SSDWG2]|uniref:Rho-binding antiterminator n=1 Tax=Pseudoalteromonas sp. SSDWG2 TaxID=3139391 RepID=UPI003BAAA554
MISCSQYDYVEIVCLFQYPIEIQLSCGDFVVGRALDTQQNAAKEECIKISTDQGDVLVVLDSIATLKVTVKNPHFDEVAFK